MSYFQHQLCFFFNSSKKAKYTAHTLYAIFHNQRKEAFKVSHKKHGYLIDAICFSILYDDDLVKWKLHVFNRELFPFPASSLYVYRVLMCIFEYMYTCTLVYLYQYLCILSMPIVK